MTRYIYEVRGTDDPIDGDKVRFDNLTDAESYSSDFPSSTIYLLEVEFDDELGLDSWGDLISEVQVKGPEQDAILNDKTLPNSCEGDCSTELTLDWDDEDYYTTDLFDEEQVDDFDDMTELFDVSEDDVCEEFSNSVMNEAKGTSDEYMDFEEFDIQSAYDTLSDTGKWYHTSKNGGIPERDENGNELKDKNGNAIVKALSSDEDEEEAGYYVFYGTDFATKAKADEVAKRIKQDFGVDIIITINDEENMIEMEVPASVDLPLVPLKSKGHKNNHSVIENVTDDDEDISDESFITELYTELKKNR